MNLNLFKEEDLPTPILSVRGNLLAKSQVRGFKENMAAEAASLVWPDNYHICETGKDLGRIAKNISSSKIFAFDTETSGLNPRKDKLYCISIWVGGHAYLINFSHRELPRFTYDNVRSTLGDYFTGNYERVGFNLSFDGHFLINNGIPYKSGYFDSEVASWLLHPDLKKGERRLKPLCEKYLGGTHETYNEKFHNAIWIAGHPKVAAHYALHDAELHWSLFKKFEAELKKFPALHKLMHDLEMPLMADDFVDEQEGFLVDTNYLTNELIPKLEKELNDQRKTIYSLGVPEQYDIDSPAQLSCFLFDYLKLPQIKGRSTDKSVLADLKDRHPSIPAITEYKTTYKLKTGFVDNWQNIVFEGKIYPSFRVIGTGTGRSSSENPNFYNVPIKVGPMIRKIIIADDDHIIISKDLKGQELRILSHLCGSGPFQKAAVSETVYEECAAAFYNVPADTLVKGDVRRDNGKKAWLAMQYGAQGGKVADIFGCSKQEADIYLANLFEKRFPEIGRYNEKCKWFAHQNGYVQTILGRRRLLDFSQCRNIYDQWELERLAINSPVQGTAADQIKLAMYLCNRYLEEHYPRSRARIRIYDEIIFWIHKEDWCPELNNTLDDIIENALPMSVPFKTSTEIYGKHWGQKEEDD